MVREYNYRNFVQDCAVVQPVIHRALDCRNRVSTQAIPYGIYGEQWQGCTNFSKYLGAISKFCPPER
jgi:hypothetical protein